MKRPFAGQFFAAILLAALPAAAIAKDPAPKAAAPKPEIASPPMWRVSDADSSATLIGTFYILPPGVDWRSRTLASAADRAETTWFEAESDTSAAQAAAAATLKARGFLKPGERLSNKLKPEDAEKLAAVAEQLGMPLADLDAMRPWHAFLALSVRGMIADGHQPGAGVERALLNEARQRSRALRFMETTEQQLSIFTRLKPADELALLTLTLRDWDNRAADLDATINAWKTGDAEALDERMNGLMRREANGAYQAIIVARNKAWADKVAEALAGPDDALIAVGASHLVGPDSLIAELVARGLTVERVGEAKN
jgi:uncharacterized protein YbaP (TraB family)